MNSSWRSPSGDFAFGFQQIRAGEFLLAIWFDNIPEKTIIWSPPIDGEKLVEEGSKIQLSEDGQFRLTDARGEKLWDAQLTGSGNVLYAAMFDTGNFVLVSQDSNLWESFNQPTDTIVPTQIMKRDSKLVARYAEKNYSRGRFRFLMQGDGNLVFYVTSFLWDTVDLINRAYWASNTVNQGYQFVFNQSGYIYLADNNGSILYSFTSKETSSTNYYQRAILEYDGVLRHYVYPKTTNGITRNPMNWSMQGSEPSNICDIKETQGSGACGYNSYCSFGDDQRPRCECPPGYSFFDPDDKMRGCKQDFISQDCNGNQDADNFEFRDKLNMDWPGTDYGYFKDVTEDWCRQSCLTDCFCSLAVFKDGECTMKKFPLSNGRMDPNLGGKTLIKIRKENSTYKSPDKGSREGSIDGRSREGSTFGSNKEDRSTLILTLTMLLSGSSFLDLVLLIATLWLVSRLCYWKRRMLQPSRANQGTSLRSFTYKELEEATNKFKEELGKGACSTVYRGVIDIGNKNMVAIKKLDKIMTESELEFQAEISAISKTNHKNLVQLLGFCNEGQHRLLVYEYMSNGSLASYLFGNLRPNWYQRAQIAFGTARGLVYLHEECSNQIIHCDIKPQNILLDDSLTARISDFGLAKLLKTGQTRTVTAIRGTKGYVAPEWFKNKPVTIKVDVYSFGILLLELICCRKSFEQDSEDENQMILADWAYDCYEEGRLYLLVQEDEEAIQDINRVERFVMIAIWCIQDDPSLRPTMKRVSQMLEGAVEVPRPPTISPVNV
ncbi:hypothetical protein SLEP1_g7676 [Rubroshorea leprosula]|uniref:Receptor-like serine/threonine-protein kinase n=1 Tax=Rubroshorea leprosula TaxID=152421 RepID=A0AAV5HZ77_9ROSI|nr:hypothetical protein SLEP1_g7676 [Rubroshorea leprosula]